MKKTGFGIALFVFFWGAVCCSLPAEAGGAGGQVREQGAAIAENDYWNGTSVRKGLYVERKNGAPALFLGEKEFRAFGVNCYDLFTGCLSGSGDRFRIDLAPARAALDVLKEQGVRVVRFNCGVYYAAELSAYLEHRDAYMDALREIAEYAGGLEIGLIPSLFWHYAAVPGYCGEPLRAWGDRSSRTAAFLKRYTEDVVTVLSGYRSLFAWEFGNEFNLQADLPNWQECFKTQNPDDRLTGGDVSRAIRMFARTVARSDPQRRMILSGHARMRPSQYHQYCCGSWETDDTLRYRKISGVFNPRGVQGMTEHVYGTVCAYASLGEVPLAESLSVAMAAARSLNKVYIVGEFAGVLPSEEAYRVYFDALSEAGVPLSLVWNFSLKGNIEHSFTADGERGAYLFALLREYNARLDGR